MDLTSFIHHRRNVFTDEFCDCVIDLFEKKEIHQETYLGVMASGVNSEIKNTTEINLFDHSEIMEKENFFEKLNNELSNHFLRNLPFRYYFDASLKLFHETCKYEVCQVQKYKKGSGHYESWHVEIENLASSKRIFSMIVYLNDVIEGGETEFLYTNMKIKPTKGSVVIFPSAFPFVHRGLKPVSGNKLIISTWLVYDP